MNFFQKRRRRKEAKHRLHEARHFRRMREDIADPEKIAALKEVERDLKDSIRRRDYEAMESNMTIVAERTAGIVGDRKYSFIREHLEIVVVALAVAMAVRSFFFQPFKIPTGSMQPTLYGRTVEQQEEPGILDSFPLKYIVFIFTGEMYKEYHAKASGDIRSVDRESKLHKYFAIGGVLHRLPKGMPVRVRIGEFVEKGELIAKGRVVRGDHIFVDRISYNFRKPKRGDIFVFRTDNIDDPRIPDKTYYIKRLVGLPGETIRINGENDILVDGEVWEIDYPEKWGDEERSINLPNGAPLYLQGHSYSRPSSLLDGPGKTIELGKDEYLPMGDNTRSSLDGRYFGGVQQEDIIGPAFMVYWPFNERWGLVD